MSKLFNLKIEKYLVGDDVEIKVYFLGWNVANFRANPITRVVIKK